MKSIYVTSVERYSGKTAVCLAIGKELQRRGYKVGFLKPLSIQPYYLDAHLADEDATFVVEALKLDAKPWDLSPVVVNRQLLIDRLSGKVSDKLLEHVTKACTEAAKGKDILLLEGGGSLREGYILGLPTPEVAKELGSKVIAVVKYRDDIRLLDDILAAKTRLEKNLCGVIINRVPDDAQNFVQKYAVPFLENQGITIFGALPEVRSLAALTVGEIIQSLNAEVLTKGVSTDKFVENLTVGAMTAEAALHRFRKQRNKAVITGGDRTDIQLAALETSTSCLVLTGHLHPSPLIIKQAESLDVPVLLVRENTLETVEQIERIFGKTRLGQQSKLAKFEEMLANYVDLERMFQCLELKPAR